jgi:hypothetical protein
MLIFRRAKPLSVANKGLSFLKLPKRTGFWAQKNANFGKKVAKNPAFALH